MNTPADTTATPLMLGLISRTDDGWLSMMEQYLGERTPDKIGALVHRVLLMADKINHTDGSFLFARTDWAQIGEYVLHLEEDEQPTAQSRNETSCPIHGSREGSREQANSQPYIEAGTQPAGGTT